MHITIESITIFEYPLCRAHRIAHEGYHHSLQLLFHQNALRQKYPATDDAIDTEFLWWLD